MIEIKHLNTDITLVLVGVLISPVYDIVQNRKMHKDKIIRFTAKL